MKKLVFTFFAAMVISGVFAQQEAQFTQFMFTKMAYNPAAAGSNPNMCLTGLYRNQWFGLEGSPTSQLLSLNAPLSNQRVGLGLTLNRQTISIFSRTSVEGNYAYRFRLGKGYLALGLQGSLLFYDGDYTDSRLKGTTALSKDNGVTIDNLNKSVPNFGAGLYYQTDEFFVGVSAPRFLNNNIDLNDDQDVIGTSVPHVYFTLGGTARLNDRLKLKPQALVKYANGAPIGIDLNVSLMIVDKYLVGTSLRAGGDRGSGIGESIDVMLGAQIVDQLYFGLAYDFTLSEIKNYNNGTVEALLRYCFGKTAGDNIENPRYFN